jgi:polyhydroxyalkanoate synthesis regulator protein
MAAVKEVKVVEEKGTIVIDVFWDGFFNSIKTSQFFQNRVEEKCLEAFESQLDLVETTLEQLIKFEEESKKLTAEWKADFQEVVNNALTGYGVQNLAEWTDKIDEAEQKIEALAFSPSKKTFKAFSKTQAQLESTLKEAIGNRQKNRAAVLDALGKYVDEQKQIQNNVLKTLKLNKRKIS